MRISFSKILILLFVVVCTVLAGVWLGVAVAMRVRGIGIEISPAAEYAVTPSQVAVSPQDSDVSDTSMPVVSPIPVFASPSSTPAVARVDSVSSTVFLAVPFTPQAPFGDWSDPLQQDGCEEASVLMVMRWVRGESLQREEALQEILTLAAAMEKQYGTPHDLSASDTASFIRSYFMHDDVEVRFAVTAEAIRAELERGRAVIVPVDGQKIGNPHFTAPGPERHMLVIKGYNEATGEFITNDPGTRRGEGFRYAYETLMVSLRDYLTGEHEPILVLRSAMISVGK